MIKDTTLLNLEYLKKKIKRNTENKNFLKNLGEEFHVKKFYFTFFRFILKTKDQVKTELTDMIKQNEKDQKEYEVFSKSILNNLQEKLITFYK